jgi:hypothetical protein
VRPLLQLVLVIVGWWMRAVLRGQGWIFSVHATNQLWWNNIQGEKVLLRLTREVSVQPGILVLPALNTKNFSLLSKIRQF